MKERHVMNKDADDGTIYKVVENHEEQYSIWPFDQENALGWTDFGFLGTKSECLAQIEIVWSDMTPLSIRRELAELTNVAAN
jgi:MbtH protein